MGMKRRFPAATWVEVKSPSPDGLYSTRVQILPTGLALALALILGPPLSSGEAGGQEVALALGTQAPAAALEDLDGNPVQLLDYVQEGKPTLLEFWAAWCENCEALEPQMEEIQEKWGDKVNVVAVAVAVSQSQRRVKRHAESQEADYPYLWDARGEAVRAYEVPGTSVVVILDGEGKVAYTGSGGSQNLVKVVEELLN
jgi:thiol-disulfide isomerase/thioredoxin